MKISTNFHLKLAFISYYFILGIIFIKRLNRFAELVNALVLKTNPFGVGSSSLPNGIWWLSLVEGTSFAKAAELNLSRVRILPISYMGE